MADAARPIDAEAVREALKTVIDPAVGMNIVDLGLIYHTEVDDEGIAVCMTMTSPACPMEQMILDDIDAALRRLAPELPCGVVLVAASRHAQRIQSALHAKVLTLGAAAWLVGVPVWGATDEFILAQWWWLAFLIITIAGERLELSRLVRITPTMTRIFVAMLALLIGATALSAFEIGQQLYGIALLALAIALFLALQTMRIAGAPWSAT